jgi:GNAT superfamily N-acetyltransferase
MDTEITIRAISLPDAETLSTLAKNIYRQYYLHLWHPGGADWYMNEYAYPVYKLKVELAAPENLHWIAYAGTQAIGYIKLILQPKLPDGDYSENAELERIYIDQLFAGKGLGRKLMQFAEAAAVMNGKKRLFLKAMDSATEAIAFYKRMGFRQKADFQLPMPTFQLMQEQFRGMVILQKEIGLTS